MLGKKALVVLLVFLLGVSISFAGEIVGEAYQITVGEGESRAISNDEVTALIDAFKNGTVNELRKCGKGTLISAALTGYDGRITVAEGVYQAQNGSASFGSAAGETVVCDGASVHINGYMELWYEHFKIAGNGYDGLGVIRAVGSSNRVYLSYLTLEADSLISSDHIVNFNGDGKKPFNMNGKTLTINSVNNIVFYGSNIVNAGHIVNLRKRFTLDSSTALTHGENASFTLGGTDASSDVTIPVCAAKNNWTIHYANPNSAIGLGFEAGASWYGPIVLAVGTGTAVINHSSYAKSPVYLYGNLSGTGNFDCKEREVYFFGTNTITGELRGSGFFTLGNEKSMGDVEKFKVTKPVWHCHTSGDASTPGFTPEKIREFLSSEKWGAADKFYVYVPEGCVFDYPYDISERWTRTFENRGQGVFQFSGVLSDLARFDYLRAGCGTIRFTGRNDNMPYRVQLTNGRFEFSDFNVSCANTSAFVSTFSDSDAEIPTTLVITNSFVSVPDNKVRMFMNEYERGARMRSVLEILSDSVVTNNIVVGYDAPNSTAAVYMRDGLVHLPCGSGGDGMIGRSGQGYWELTGGDMSIYSSIHFGFTPGAFGLHYIMGGECEVENGGYQIGSSGKGIFYQTAGRFRSNGNIRVSDCAYDDNLNKDATGLFTVEGSQAQCEIVGDIILARRFDCTATVNINDSAVLEAARIVRGTWGRGYQNYADFYTNDFAYVNFNGGILRANSSIEIFGTEDAVENLILGGRKDNFPNAVTVFGNGAIIDSSNCVVDVSVPLVSPIGNGVISVSLQGVEELDKEGYIAPPLVEISGDGTNATAVALFDSKTRKWTGIKVTSPGWGYTTAKAIVSRGGKTSTFELDCVLGDVSGGGLEKRGMGELRLKRMNTYTGTTTVSAGKLVLADEGTIDNSRKLHIADGAEFYAENGKAISVDELAGCGTLRGDVVIERCLKVKASDLIKRKGIKVKGVIAFAIGATIEVENDVDLPVASYPLFRATEDVVAKPQAINGVPSKWEVGITGGYCRLYSPKSISIVVR